MISKLLVSFSSLSKKYAISVDVVGKLRYRSTSAFSKGRTPKTADVTILPRLGLAGRLAKIFE